MRSTKLALSLMAIVVAAVTYVVLAGSVSKSLTDRDRQAIQSLAIGVECRNPKSFEQEIACVRDVQLRVQASVKDTRCEESGDPIEPMNFLERGFGCCFDRARFMSKALAYYGMTTRHVALHDRGQYGVLAYAVPGVASHATTEVLTSRGWMGVDSNEPFLLVTRAGAPKRYADLPGLSSESLAYPINPSGFYQKDLMVTYGLYSRHGKFHGVDLPAPEINYSDFLRYNFG